MVACPQWVGLHASVLHCYVGHLKSVEMWCDLLLAGDRLRTLVGWGRTGLKRDARPTFKLAGELHSVDAEGCCTDKLRYLQLTGQQSQHDAIPHSSYRRRSAFNARSAANKMSTCIYGLPAQRLSVLCRMHDLAAYDNRLQNSLIAISRN
jgi:hypothetical protein